MKEIEHNQCNSSSLIPEENHSNEPVSLPTPFESDETDCFPISEPIIKRNPSTSAQREYATAMRAIRSSAIHKSATPASAKRNRVPALVLQDEVNDEWLEEDMPTASRKLTKKSSSKSSDLESLYQDSDNVKK